MIFHILLLFLLLLLCGGECLKLLAIFPAPSRSHYNLGTAFARGLAERGHDMTIISPFSNKNLPKNATYRQVVLTGYTEQIQAQRNKRGNIFELAETNKFYSTVLMTYTIAQMTERFFTHPNVEELLKSGETFDVVIVEQFMNDAQKALAKHFGAHLITMSFVGSSGWVNPLVANPAPPSYVPGLMTRFSGYMTFFERLNNATFVVYYQLIQHILVYPEQNRQVRKYISEDINLYDVLYNSSIVFLNSHPAINQPVPHVPSMIEIGGFHVQPAGKLPADLQKYIDDAKEGVVYFSLGSHIKSIDLPVEKRNALINVFAKLKQKVLWKWEDENLPGKPDNVKILNWAPQSDILADKNVKGFITHGGLLSLTETVYHGVPILAIPVIGDQTLNAKLAVENGIGLVLPYKDLTEEALKLKLNELLTNSIYYQNAQKRSKIFHDRETKPMDAAVSVPNLYFLRV